MDWFDSANSAFAAIPPRYLWIVRKVPFCSVSGLTRGVAIAQRWADLAERGSRYRAKSRYGHDVEGMPIS
jgi:hypothetical protein